MAKNISHIRKCPICKNSKDLLSLGGYIRCLACYTFFVSNFPNNTNFREILEKGAKGIINDTRVDLTKYDYKNRLFALKKISRKIANVLDVGCGNGLFIRFLISQGIKSFGFDQSEKIRKYLLSKNIPNFKTPADIPSHHFDVITSFDVIEHVMNLREHIHLIRKKIKVDGLVMMTTPNAAGYSARILKKAWWVFGPEAHYVLFSPISLKILLEQEGFNVLSISTDTIAPWFTPTRKFHYKILNKLQFLVFFPFKWLLFRFYLGDNIQLIARIK